MFALRLGLLLMLAILAQSDEDSIEEDYSDEDDYNRKRCISLGTVKVGIYIVMDTSYTKELNKTLNSTAYLQVLVNTVEAYFWNFTCPDVKLTLVGVKALNESEEGIFKKFKVPKNETTKMLDPAYTLAMFNRWVNNTARFQDATLVYLLTSEMIYDFMGAYKLEMKAASYRIGPCTKRPVALSHDDGRTFSGVSGMVQQIANSFGITWDDSRSPKSSCRVDEGYIMTKNGEATKLANFSSCSYKTWTLYYFLLHQRGKECFDRNHTAMISENKELPAGYYKGCDYCKILFTSEEVHGTCKNSSQSTESPLDTVAENGTCKVNCSINGRNHTVNSLDGKACSSGKVCIHGACVTRKMSQNSTELINHTDTR